MRLALGAALLAVLASGCGSTLAAGEGGSTTTPAVIEAAPPIMAVDRATDLDYVWTDDRTPSAKPAGASSSVEICFVRTATAGPTGEPPPALQTTTDSSSNSCDHLSDAEKAKLRAQMQTYVEAIRPAGDARVVAELPAAGGTTVELAAWGNKAGELCLDAEARLSGVSVGGGVFGPCVPDGGDRCNDSICAVDAQTNEPGDAFAVAGVVPASADLITITVRGGDTRAYPLAGPLVPGFASRRIFMADLGAERYRRIAVSEGGSVLATLDKDPTSVAYEECAHDVGAPKTAEEARAAEKAVDSCLQGPGRRLEPLPAVTTRTGAPPAG